MWRLCLRHLLGKGEVQGFHIVSPAFGNCTGSSDQSVVLSPVVHSGVTRLAAVTGARIVPVYNAVWHFPHRYCLSVGEPLRVPAIDPEEITAQWLKEQTERIRDAVAALTI